MQEICFKLVLNRENNLNANSTAMVEIEAKLLSNKIYLPTNVFKEISIYNPEISALKSIQIKGIDSTVSEYDSFFPEKCSFLMKQMRDCTAIIGSTEPEGIMLNFEKTA